MQVKTGTVDSEPDSEPRSQPAAGSEPARLSAPVHAYTLTVTSARR